MSHVSPRLASTYLTFQFLRGQNFVEPELEEIQSSQEGSSSGPMASNEATSPPFSALFTQPRYLRPLLIAMILMFGQQFSGVNAVLFFRQKKIKDFTGPYDEFKLRQRCGLTC